MIIIGLYGSNSVSNNLQPWTYSQARQNKAKLFEAMEIFFERWSHIFLRVHYDILMSLKQILSVI